MKRSLLIALLLAASAALGQTTHNFPALDTNNMFTGNNVFSKIAPGFGTYAAMIAVSSPPAGMIWVQTDGNSGTECTAGGGSSYAWCAYIGSTWVLVSSGSGGGTTYPDITDDSGVLVTIGVPLTANGTVQSSNTLGAKGVGGAFAAAPAGSPGSRTDLQACGTGVWNIWGDNGSSIIKFCANTSTTYQLGNVVGGGTTHTVAINQNSGVTLSGVGLNSDQLLQGVTSADPQAVSVPDCDDTAGQHLNYDTTAHTFSCGTSLPTTTTSVTAFSTTQSGNLLAAPVDNKGYRVGYYMWQAASGSGGTCASNATATVAVTWTDPSSTAQTKTFSAMNVPPTLAAGAWQDGQVQIVTKSGTAVAYSITWSDGDCSTQPTAQAQLWIQNEN